MADSFASVLGHLGRAGLAVRGQRMVAVVTSDLVARSLLAGVFGEGG